MARKIKIDNALQKRFEYEKRKHKSPRDIVIYFLIVCEGEKTEPNYFKAFPKQIGKFVYDIQFDGGAINTLGVVEKAIELRDKSSQKFDSVWAVFDRDSFPATNFNSAIQKAEANDIKCAWSNEAFELWYLLHFYNRTTAMTRDEYKKTLENAINEKDIDKNFNFKYVKNALDTYNILEKFGNQALAIKWARALSDKIDGQNFANYNPTTMVFKLVEELIGQSKSLEKEVLKKYKRGK